ALRRNEESVIAIIRRKNEVGGRKPGPGLTHAARGPQQAAMADTHCPYRTWRKRFDDSRGFGGGCEGSTHQDPQSRQERHQTTRVTLHSSSVAVQDCPT